jgi:hypothetical protein
MSPSRDVRRVPLDIPVVVCSRQHCEANLSSGPRAGADDSQLTSACQSIAVLPRLWYVTAQHHLRMPDHP